MTGRKIALYYAWSRPGEVGAPLEVIENRFPALFESRRLFYPHYREFSDPERFDQSVAGFLDHIMKPNFTDFLEQAGAQTGHPVTAVERIDDGGACRPLDTALLAGIDTLIVISFDSVRTKQTAGVAEIAAVRDFLADPDHLAFICPHHDIGGDETLAGDVRARVEEVDFLHHGDRSIPPQQRFGGFSRSLLAGLGIAVENRFGLRPAAAADGSPAPIEIEHAQDRLCLLDGVSTFNLHPHLPQLERLGDAATKMDVLARQAIDLAAPPHPYVQSGRATFDALLQSKEGVFAGTILVSDATLWSGTAGGLDNLRRLWTNVVLRPRRG
ncbi:MAG TPA: hypothetical protein VHZ78_11760 [Rhizomicrobium sp.]|jgi:hypothetical protein|nr:hypothetical protein [Rhizomicrobium sp.]